jgi:hypothetical protein
MDLSMNKDLLQTTPPLTISGMVFWGIPLNDWVLMLTALYTIFLIIEKWPVVKQRIQSWFKK